MVQSSLPIDERTLILCGGAALGGVMVGMVLGGLTVQKVDVRRVQRLDSEIKSCRIEAAFAQEQVAEISAAYEGLAMMCAPRVGERLSPEGPR